MTIENPVDGISYADLEKYSRLPKIQAMMLRRHGEDGWTQDHVIHELKNELRRQGSLVGIKRELSRRYGDLQWGNAELLAYIFEREALKASGSLPKGKTGKVGPGATVEQRLAAYKSQYPDARLNDDSTLHRMCVIEFELEAIQAQREFMTSGDELGKYDIDNYKKLSELYLKYSAEHRACQTALGITRAMREEDIDKAQTIKDFIQEGKKFIKEKTVRIECPHCKGTRKLNFGFVAFHFDGKVPWRFETVCPNPDCRLPFTIRGRKAVLPGHPDGLLTESTFLLDIAGEVSQNGSDIGPELAVSPLSSNSNEEAE